MSTQNLEEPVLEDDYPVFYGYYYMVDGRIETSDVQGNVKRLKQDIISQGRTAVEVRRCDMIGRGFFGKD